jgi:hypothetical protein
MGYRAAGANAGIIENAGNAERTYEAGAVYLFSTKTRQRNEAACSGNIKELGKIIRGRYGIPEK